jgi:hypothetical protein
MDFRNLNELYDYLEKDFLLTKPERELTTHLRKMNFKRMFIASVSFPFCRENFVDGVPKTGFSKELILDCLQNKRVRSVSQNRKFMPMS